MLIHQTSKQLIYEIDNEAVEENKIEVSVYHSKLPITSLTLIIKFKIDV
jgi:hypothetical protein